MHKMLTFEDPNCVVLEESYNHVPTYEELELYARSIGIDLNEEPELMYIAKEGVNAPVPEGWRVLQDGNDRIFYQQKKTGVCVWDHPLDSYYRQRVVQAKQKKKNNAETVVPEDNEPQLLPATPNKSETVYQPLPSPRVPKPSSTFKTPMPPPAVPAIPPAAQQTASQSSHNRVATAVASPDRNDEIGEGDSFPHVYSSPTAQTPVTTTNEVPSRRSKAVLTESTSQNGRTYRRQQNSLRYTHQPLPSENKENNPIIDVDTRISDRFMRVLRVSTSSRPQQRPLFEVAEDGLNSCLYSPPDSPQIDNDCTPNRPFTRLSSSLVEFDGNESLRFMLDEKRRLQDKLDYLKLTYKAYKLRMSSIDSNIKMFCSASTLSPRVSLQSGRCSGFHHYDVPAVSPARQRTNRSQSFRINTGTTAATTAAQVSPAAVSTASSRDRQRVPQQPSSHHRHKHHNPPFNQSNSRPPATTTNTSRN